MPALPSNFLRMQEASELDGRGLILMDDTGSTIETEDGRQERTSWVAVLIPPSQTEYAITQMDGLVDALRKEFGTSEFHAHEVFQRKGSWSEVPVPALKAVVATLASIFGTMRFPIVVQTFWRGNESHRKLAGMIPYQHARLFKRKFRIDFRSPKDAAFAVCLLRCHEYIRAEVPGARWEVFADAGKRQPGQSSLAPVSWEGSDFTRIYYEDSSLCRLIQLADFAAYFMNRSQQIAHSRSRKCHDEELLDILGRQLNFINIGYQDFTRQYSV